MEYDGLSLGMFGIVGVCALGLKLVRETTMLMNDGSRTVVRATRKAMSFQGLPRKGELHSPSCPSIK